MHKSRKKGGRVDKQSTAILTGPRIGLGGGGGGGGERALTAVKVGVERPKPIPREVIEFREEVEILGLRPKPLAGIVTGWE